MIGGDKPVTVFHIGSKDVGFYNYYIDNAVASRVNYNVKNDEQILSHIGCVFFIPTKYRVYKDFIKGRILPEPAAGFKALEAYYQPRAIPVIDLTAILRKAARNELSDGQYLYWRDDTHWNGNGIRVVAPEVKSCLMDRIERDLTHR